MRVGPAMAADRTVQDPMAAGDMEEDLCALLFNVQGMLHEKVKARLGKVEQA